MKKEFKQIDLSSLKSEISRDAIDDDFSLLDDISKVPFFDYPTKIDFTVVLICLKGTIEGSINLVNYTFEANRLGIVFFGQIVQYHHISDDFSGLFIVLSKRFGDNLELNIKDSTSLFFYIQNNPVIAMNESELALLLDYYSMLQKTVKMENSHRREIVKHLLHALLYSANTVFQQHKRPETKMEELFDAFYNLVLRHHRESREVGFYADKLCLTPKYLSTVIKASTGKTAYEWINDYVVLEAKALLKSGYMTVQQISDTLSFPNQSFFGQYFKRHTGLSPSEYRGK
ncbi:MAG: helix-turn-helix domain-containing protein [Tannerellaceae bacterium]|nr:helix-turn-helix domain-containing protein [Tannerellaceae bacterium]